MKLFWLLLYYGIVQFLPNSSFPGFRWVRLIRARAASRFAPGVSVGANVERRAFIGGGRGIVVGDGSGIGSDSQLHGPVVIGKGVLMGPQVLIYTRNHQFADPGIPIVQQGYRSERPVTIEDDVWIGARAIILPGVKVGRGAVIGAGAVVAKEVEPYAIVAGNPAMIIGRRQ